MTRKAEKTPEVATTAPSRIKGRLACAMTQALATAKKPESRRLATTIIMPSSSVMRVEVDRLVGVFERQRARCDHEAGADQGDAGPVDAQAGNPADREREIASDKDDAGGDATALPAHSIAGRKQNGRQRGGDGYRDH